MPNINLDDAYILDETGAEVDKVTGLFTKDEGTTSGEKAFAQLNIGTAGSNRNLLDNPWWGSGEVVNQRGVTAKPSNNQYGIDRWIVASGADANTMAFGTSGITFTISASSIWNTQKTQNPSAWSGKTLTASVLLSDGTIKSGTAAFTLGTNTVFYTDNALTLSLNTSGYFVVAVRASQTIRAIKLELGSVSTLANDVPPDYETELWKCQHYFVRLRYLAYFTVGIGYAPSSTYFKIDIPVPASLRDAVLQFSYTGSPTINGNAITGGYEIYRTTTGHIQLHLATNGLTAGNVYGLYTGPNEFIMNISADL